jgi:uncharacterized membrane protein YccC
MTLTPPTPGSNEDPLVRLAAGIILGIGFIAKLWPLIPAVKRGKAKRKLDTDERNALVIATESLKLQTTILDLQRKLDEREAELIKAQRDVEKLTPLANETEALRETNKGLEAELKALRERKDLS